MAVCRCCYIQAIITNVCPKGGLVLAGWIGEMGWKMTKRKKKDGMKEKAGRGKGKKMKMERTNIDSHHDPGHSPRSVTLSHTLQLKNAGTQETGPFVPHTVLF